MWGRYFGLAVGLALLGEGLLLGRPQLVGALSTVDLGPFTPYRLIVALLAGAVGAAVIIASMLRETAPAPRRAQKTAPVLALAEEPMAPAPSLIAAASLLPIMAAPEPRPPMEHDEELQPFPAAVHAFAEPQPAARPAMRPEPEPVFAPAPPPEPEPVFVPIAAPPPPPPAPAAPPLGDRTVFLQLTDEGHQLRGVGRFDDAFDRYAEALSLARRRAAALQDAGARRDLATALTNVGDLHDRDGRLEQAIELHQESLDLRRGLAAEHPDDPAFQRSFSLGLERLGDARDARGHRSRARDLFRERLGVVERLAMHAPADPTLTTEVSATRERLRELDELLQI